MILRAATHVAQWLDGWMRPGDLGIIATTTDGAPLGAAWCRRFDASNYGFVDDATPILAIAVDEPHRNRGLGSALLTALATAARQTGVPALRVAMAPNGQLVLRLPL